MKICLNCGDKLLDGAKKCPICGKKNFASVNAKDTASIEQIQNSVPNPKEGLHPKWMNSYAVNRPQKKPSPQTKRERIKENKANGVACCPKCGSASLSGAKQGIGIGKAAVGVWALGPIGAAAGAIGSNKTRVTCLNCGHKWKL